MSEFTTDDWLANVPNAPVDWLSRMTRAVWETARTVLHTAFIPGQMPHYLRARRSRRQLDALAMEWGRRRANALSLQLFRMADQMARIVRQHQVELVIRRLEGRVGGTPSEAARTALPGEINWSFVDRFTLAHGAAGVLAGSIGVGGWAALAIALGWEIVEPRLKRAVPAVFPNATQDTIANSTGDIAAFMLGWYIANRLRGPMST